MCPSASASSRRAGSTCWRPRRRVEPRIVDETLEPFDPAAIAAGDVVGIGIHTGNALRGYEIGRRRASAGAHVVFGGIHATLYPDEAARTRAARTRSSRATASRSGRRCCGTARPARPSPRTTAAGARRDASCPAAGTCCRRAATCGPRCRRCAAARSTARSARSGGPTASSRASARSTRAREIVELRRRGFRFIALADDNFYPVTLDGPAHGRAPRRTRAQLERLEAHPRRAVRADGGGWRSCRATWCSSRRSRWRPPRTRSSSTPCASAHIKGALVGVEVGHAGRAEGRLQGLQRSGRRAGRAAAGVPAHGVHVLGSFIFGLPSDRRGHLRRDARRSRSRPDLTFAQFVMLTPFPGTLDFAPGRRRSAPSRRRVDGVPVSRATG